ncbi:MAG: ATP-binding protein [Candidatus Thiodiazotropha sp.]
MNDKLKIISANLSPRRPIRSSEFLRGRITTLEEAERELRYFHGTLFIFGYRGVGKTSLARTAAQIVTQSDREHIYVACAPGARMLDFFREIAEELLKLALRLGVSETVSTKTEINISLSPSIKASFEKKTPKIEAFDDANAAIRVLHDLDQLIPNADSTVIVLDELEELNDDDRTDLAYLIKQLGDQEFNLKFILVGIAENVHELIGAHESVPRYIKEMSLKPLDAQHLMDIVSNAASHIGVSIPREILYRIAIIGNGYPHFSHLMGQAILTEAVLSNATDVNGDIYKKGVDRAVIDSFQELRISYEAATQRGEDHYKYLVWALAHSDLVDIRIDEWIKNYYELITKYSFTRAEESKLKSAIGNLKNEPCGKIIRNTPARYGSVEQRYRYKRFSNTLMRGHVRLQAESEGYTLGEQKGI